MSLWAEPQIRARMEKWSAGRALLLACLAACQGDAPELGTPRDGNVTVVNNTTALWTDQTAWRIEEKPLVSIGQVDGPPDYQLHWAMRAVRLADGTIVINNAGTKQIRFYDSNGKHVRSVGRAGAGPGEYESIPFFRRYGADSLIAWDGRLDRGTVIALNGTYGRNVPRPDFGGAWIMYLDTFGDGSLLGIGTGYSGGRLPQVEMVEEAVERVALRARQEQSIEVDSALLFRLRPSGAIDTIGGFFSAESYRLSKIPVSMPFAHRMATATQGELLHYGTSHAFEIRTYTSKGKLVRITRSNRPNPPLTRDVIDEFIERSTARIRNPAARQQQRAKYASIEFPKTLPAFSELLVDGEGNLWVSAYHEFMAPQPRWTVLDKAGKLLGEVAMPPRFTVYEIGADYVLGKQVDELDVERIVLHRLIKP